MYFNETNDDIDELIALIRKSFNDEYVSVFLQKIGLLSDDKITYSGNLEKHIFLHGSPTEVYTKREIDYIESVNEILVFSDFFKKTNKNNIACRIVACRLYSSDEDAIEKCIMFEKIFNKSFEGFNVFFFVVDDAIYLGSKSYDYSGNDCFISSPLFQHDDEERLIDYLSYSLLNTSFLSYYEYIRDMFIKEYRSKKHIKSNTDIRAIKTSEYIEILEDIEHKNKLSFTFEKQRCFEILYSDNNPKIIKYEELLLGIFNDLSFIHSSKINTLEILFDAEEIARISSKVEEQTNEFISSNTEYNNSSVINEEIFDTIDDPEQIIKVLKNKRVFS